MPQGMHNARPFAMACCSTTRGQTWCVTWDAMEPRRAFPVPVYDPSELEHAELADGQLARQGFGRGLCVINDRIIAAGSSPSTITLYDLDVGTEITRVNFSMDVRNAIHGLEVWPY